MFSRFRIEDLISQDSASVVYLGLDDKTGERAALRRFFLRSGSGTGIAEEDQAAFLEAIALLREVKHPSLRRVLEGGLDEVDGVPYVATEWVDGEFLRDVLAQGFLSSEDGELLIREGLEVAAYLESFFGEGAHWLKIHPNSLIVRALTEGKQFTFSLSLDRWMGIERGEDGLQELATLVEQACDLTAAIHLGGGGVLGEWVRYVRERKPGVSAAREELDAIAQRSLGAEEAASGETPEVSAPEFMAPQRKSALAASGKNGVGMVMFLVVTVLLCAGGAFLYVKTREAKEQAVVSPSTSGEDEDAKIAEQVVNAPPKPDVVPDEKKSPAAESFAERALRAQERLRALQAEENPQLDPEGRTEFLATEVALLTSLDGQEVTVIGTVHHVRQTKATLVFEFSAEHGRDSLCARLKKSDDPEATLERIEEFKGKQFRFRGTVGNYFTGAFDRVFLKLDSLEDVSSS